MYNFLVLNIKNKIKTFNSKFPKVLIAASDFWSVFNEKRLDKKALC